MSGARRRVLVVEDEAHLAAGLKLNFDLEGYDVDVARTAREAAQRLAGVGAYDVLVLDVMLPDLDGFSLCRRIREAGNYVPLIMLTARDAPEDRVEGLEAGADDYLVKPFALGELLARVRSALRRRGWERGGGGAPAASHSVLAFGRARVDFDAREAVVDGAPVKLTQLESDLLRYLATHADRVVTRDELLEKVWKLRNYSNGRTVDNFISRLRRLFERDAQAPVHFLSVRGAGYRFAFGDV